MRIGIYGGSFNPIHHGHIGMAQALLDKELVDEVWFLVSPHNPLKQADTLWPEDVRLRLAREAVEGRKGMVVSDFEMHLPRPSYMVSTLLALTEAYPQHEFTLVMGTDNWQRFDRWYRHEDIMSRHRIIVVPRGTGTGQLLEVTDGQVRPIEGAIKEINISSTEIRNKLNGN